MATENKKKKILVIDDESVRFVLEDELTDEGYEVLLADRASQADKILAEVIPDLIILDINMPEIDGITYLNKIRKPYSFIPIILYSAYPEYKMSFEVWGCDAYIIKSSNLNELKDTIKRLLIEKKILKKDDLLLENIKIKELLRNLEDELEEKNCQISKLEEKNCQLTKVKTEFLKHNVIVKPHWGIPKVQEDDNYVFVLMPYKEEWSDIIWEIIRGVIDEMGFRCERADDKTGKFIMNDIWDGINQAKIVIADLSSSNPNVSYEVGMSDVLGKAQILLSQNPKEVPFDFLGVRLLPYSYIHGGVAKLKTDLKERINKIIGMCQWK